MRGEQGSSPRGKGALNRKRRQGLRWKLGAVKATGTTCWTESWRQSYESRGSFICLTWSPIAAEAGAGLGLEVGLVMGQSSCRGRNLVETLASWSGSRQTEVPGAKLSQDELCGAARYRDQQTSRNHIPWQIKGLSRTWKLRSQNQSWRGIHNWDRANSNISGWRL